MGHLTNQHLVRVGPWSESRIREKNLSTMLLPHPGLIHGGSGLATPNQSESIPLILLVILSGFQFLVL